MEEIEWYFDQRERNHGVAFTSRTFYKNAWSCSENTYYSCKKLLAVNTSSSNTVKEHSWKIGRVFSLLVFLVFISFPLRGWQVWRVKKLSNFDDVIFISDTCACIFWRIQTRSNSSSSTRVTQRELLVVEDSISCRHTTDYVSRKKHKSSCLCLEMI